MDERIVELTVAAEKDMMLVVRMTTSGVLSRTGLTLDDLDDMKMAVDEACSCLMSQPSKFGRLSLRYVCGSGQTSICITGCNASVEACGCPAEDDGQNDDILRCILESMADRVVIKRFDGGISAIELQKNCVKTVGAAL